jgi:hypothetical protein
VEFHQALAKVGPGGHGPRGRHTQAPRHPTCCEASFLAFNLVSGTATSGPPPEKHLETNQGPQQNDKLYIDKSGPMHVKERNRHRIMRKTPPITSQSTTVSTKHMRALRPPGGAETEFKWHSVTWRAMSGRPRPSAVVLVRPVRRRSPHSGPRGSGLAPCQIVQLFLLANVESVESVIALVCITVK